MSARTPMLVLLLLVLASLAACGTRDSMQGAGGDNGGHARVKIGVPF